MFRRSGSFVAFHVIGRAPDPRGEAFLEALAANRFRSIEDAASEEASIGWVTAGDPAGESFDLEDMDLDRALWLRIRIDKKKLPGVWMQIRKSQAERSAGRRLSAAERKELKEGLLDELLPRILPSVQLIDVLYEPKRQQVLLFGTSTALRDEFRKLWFRTFACDVEEADPGTLAAHTELDSEAQAYLQEVAPVLWNDEPEQYVAPRPVASQTPAPSHTHDETAPVAARSDDDHPAEDSAAASAEAAG